MSASVRLDDGTDAWRDIKPSYGCNCMVTFFLAKTISIVALTAAKEKCVGGQKDRLLTRNTYFFDQGISQDRFDRYLPDQTQDWSLKSIDQQSRYACGSSMDDRL